MKLIPPTDPILWEPCNEVQDYVREVMPSVIPMMDIMRKKNGAGLAAPQVGIPLRFFILKGPPFTVVINPEWIVAGAGYRSAGLEGCLSFPQAQSVFKVRQTEIEVAYQRGSDGKFVRELLEDFDARVFQHETDHLNGFPVYPRPLI